MFHTSLVTGCSDCDGVLPRSVNDIQCPGWEVSQRRGFCVEPWRIRNMGKRISSLWLASVPSCYLFDLHQRSHPPPSNRAPLSSSKAEDDSLVRESHRKQTSTCRHNFGWPGNNFQRWKVIGGFYVAPIWWHIFPLLKVCIHGREADKTA